jgi:ribonuclease D
MSLDAAEIDLSRSFTPGMGYVALSRVRSLDGVYLGGINNMALSMHPQIFEFDARLREASEELASTVDDLAEDAPEDVAGDDNDDRPRLPVNEELLSKLKQWRYQKSQADGVAPFIIAHNAHLEAIAANPPATVQALLTIPGFGPKKIEAYGEGLLKVVGPFIEAAAPAGAEMRTADVAKPLPDNGDSIADASSEGETPPPPPTTDWSDSEDAALLEMFNEGQTLQQVCQSLQRSPNSVWNRLAQLLHH